MSAFVSKKCKATLKRLAVQQKKNIVEFGSLGILVVYVYVIALTLKFSKSLWVIECPYLVSRNICAKFSKMLFTAVVKQSV